MKLLERVPSYSGQDPPPSSGYSGAWYNSGIVGKGNTYLNVGFDGGYYYAYWYDQSGQYLSVRASGQTPLNEWHHFVAIFDGDKDTVTLYDNGNQVAQSGTIWKGMHSDHASHNLKMGTGSSTTEYKGLPLGGLVDDLKIYHTASCTANKPIESSYPLCADNFPKKEATLANIYIGAKAFSSRPEGYRIGAYSSKYDGMVLIQGDLKRDVVKPTQFKVESDARVYIGIDARIEDTNARAPLYFTRDTTGQMELFFPNEKIPLAIYYRDFAGGSTASFNLRVAETISIVFVGCPPNGCALHFTPKVQMTSPSFEDKNDLIEFQSQGDAEKSNDHLILFDKNKKGHHKTITLCTWAKGYGTILTWIDDINSLAPMKLMGKDKIGRGYVKTFMASHYQNLSQNSYDDGKWHHYCIANNAYNLVYQNIYNETKSNLPSAGWKDIDSSFTFTRNGNIWKNNYNGRRGAQSEDQIEKTSNRVGVYFKTRRRDKNLYVGLREGENSGNLPFEISYAFKLKSNRQLYI